MSTKDLRFFTIIFAIIVNMMFVNFCITKTNSKIDQLEFNLNNSYYENQICLVNETNLEIEEEFVWWTDYDLELLARAIFWEAGSDEILDEHQQLVGAVIVARKNDPRCPNTIYDVIMDDRYGIQYSTRNKIISDNQPEIPQRCYDNALAVLNGEIDYPSDLIYQSNFKQGFETWKTFETSYSTTYFCRG